MPHSFYGTTDSETLTVGELIRLLSYWSPDTPVTFVTPDDIHNIGNAVKYDDTDGILALHANQ